MNVSPIEIRRQSALIGIETTKGRLEIEQPGPTVDMKQIPSELSISRTKGGLEIDQEKAWDALGQGSNLETMKHIYALGPEMALQGLARIVESGNRMAAIHLKGNPIADMAGDWQRTYEQFDFRGEPSIDNVDLHYTADQLSFEATRARVDLNVQVNHPVIQYEPAKVDIYLRQKPSLEMLPPQIDLSV